MSSDQNSTYNKSNTDTNPDLEDNLLGDIGKDNHEFAEDALGNLPRAEPGEKIGEDSEDHTDTDLKSVPSLEDELAKTKDQLLRALADAENTRKRAQREKEDTAVYAVTNFARDLLSVADNMARAIESIKTQENDDLKPLIEGVEITEKELLKAFEKNKIKRIDALNQPFDHNFHQAMIEIPTDEHDEGIVIQEMQVGYKIGDRLLRPAMVGVSKKT